MKSIEMLELLEARTLMASSWQLVWGADDDWYPGVTGTYNDPAWYQNRGNETLTWSVGDLPAHTKLAVEGAANLQSGNPATAGSLSVAAAGQSSPMPFESGYNVYANHVDRANVQTAQEITHTTNSTNVTMTGTGFNRQTKWGVSQYAARLYALIPSLDTFTLTNAANADQTSTTNAFYNVQNLRVGGDQNQMTTVDVAAVIDPNDAAANALVRWAVFDTSGTKITDRSFANADQTFTADWSNNSGFVFKAGVDINNDGVLATEEMAHTINLAATTVIAATNISISTAAGSTKKADTTVTFTDTVFATNFKVKTITAAPGSPALNQGDLAVTASNLSPDRKVATVTIAYQGAAFPLAGATWTYSVVMRDQNDPTLIATFSVTIKP